MNKLDLLIALINLTSAVLELLAKAFPGAT